MPPPNPSHRQATGIPRQTPTGKNTNITNSRAVKRDKFNFSPKTNIRTMPTARMLNTLAVQRSTRSKTGLVFIELFIPFLLPKDHLCQTLPAPRIGQASS